MEHKPWIEKYRPAIFEDIVLNDLNKQIFKNIIKNNTFPNLLFYGPPGTGKTTTIINLIKKYHSKYNENTSTNTKAFVIHLNASDDRGIDVIRNQIYQFVHTKSLFGTGLKFVILDEADYMTKNAQQALKYLIQKYNKNVKFCLVCNYISRIDKSLQNEFIKLHFSKLPHEQIMNYLKKIIKNENLRISKKALISIRAFFKSDIRSMVNYIQSNNEDININIINTDFWSNLTQLIIANNDTQKTSISYINEKSKYYNQDIITFIKNYISYLLNTEDIILTTEFMEFCMFIIHNNSSSGEFILKYFIYNFVELYKFV
jgi:DNA polymerase III delta prime subunit